MVRSGAVEIVFDGRVLDLLGEGELFGHASMLSGLPTGFEARAGEDTVCYRIPAEIAQESLSRPAGLAVRRALAAGAEIRGRRRRRHRAGHRPATAAGRLADPQPTAVVCPPDTPIREAAEMMTAAHATSVVVDLGDGSLGILTDRDLRTRVVADGLPGETPGVGGDVRAGVHVPARPARRRRPARDARPRLSPLPGRVGDRDGSSGSSRRSTSSPRRRAPRSTCAGGSPEPRASTS